MPWANELVVEHPPTIWVISNGGISKPAIEEVTSSELNRMIDDVVRKDQAVGKQEFDAKEERFEPPTKTIEPGVNP